MARFMPGTTRWVLLLLAAGIFISEVCANSLAAVEQPATAPDAVALAELDGFALGLEEANANHAK